jgi:hypothetical protein
MCEAYNLSPAQKLEAPTKGAWHTVGLSGVVGIHAALLPTSQVMFFARPEYKSHRYNDKIINGLAGDINRQPSAPDVTLSTIIDISRCPPYNPDAVHVEHNPFCAGHTFLPDGRLLIAGGDKKKSTPLPADPGTPDNTQYGLNKLRVFNHNEKELDNRWQSIGNISGNRWYPTCTLLHDGRVFIISGSIDDMQNTNNQIPTCETIPAMKGGPQYLHFLVEAWPYHSYPFVFQVPSESLFVFSKDSAYFLELKEDVFGRERWVVENGPKLIDQPAKHYPNNATEVLLPLLPDRDPKKDYAAEVLLIGGGGKNIYSHWVNTKIPGIGHAWEVTAEKKCFKLKVYPDVPDTEWQPVESMNNERIMPDAVLLPDGNVLVVNGGKKGFSGGNAGTGPALPKVLLD